MVKIEDFVIEFVVGQASDFCAGTWTDYIVIANSVPREDPLTDQFECDYGMEFSVDRIVDRGVRTLCSIEGGRKIALHRLKFKASAKPAKDIEEISKLVSTVLGQHIMNDPTFEHKIILEFVAKTNFPGPLSMICAILAGISSRFEHKKLKNHPGCTTREFTICLPDDGTKTIIEEELKTLLNQYPAYGSYVDRMTLYVTSNLILPSVFTGIAKEVLESRSGSPLPGPSNAIQGNQGSDNADTSDPAFGFKAIITDQCSKRDPEYNPMTASFEPGELESELPTTGNPHRGGLMEPSTLFMLLYRVWFPNPDWRRRFLIADPCASMILGKMQDLGTINDNISDLDEIWEPIFKCEQEKQQALIPIYGTNHYALLHLDFSDGTSTLYDSKTSRKQDDMKTIAKITVRFLNINFEHRLGRMPLKDALSIPDFCSQQTDQTSCGLHVIRNAIDLMTHGRVTQCQDIREFREDLIDLLKLRIHPRPPQYPARQTKSVLTNEDRQKILSGIVDDAKKSVKKRTPQKSPFHSINNQAGTTPRRTPKKRLEEDSDDLEELNVPSPQKRQKIDNKPNSTSSRTRRRLFDGESSQGDTDAFDGYFESSSNNEFSGQTVRFGKSTEIRIFEANLNGSITKVCSEFVANDFRSLKCPFCEAYNFSNLPESSCCLGGQIHVPQMTLPDRYLWNLVTKDDSKAKNFQNNTIAYNHSVSYASLARQGIQQRPFGPQTVKNKGSIYTMPSALEPHPGQPARFAEIFLYHNPDDRANMRMNIANSLGTQFGKVQKDILMNLDALLQSNPFTQFYQKFHEIYETDKDAFKSMRMMLIPRALVKKEMVEAHKGCFNIPAKGSIVAVFYDSNHLFKTPTYTTRLKSAKEIKRIALPDKAWNILPPGVSIPTQPPHSRSRMPIHPVKYFHPCSESLAFAILFVDGQPFYERKALKKFPKGTRVQDALPEDFHGRKVTLKSLSEDLSNFPASSISQIDLNDGGSITTDGSGDRSDSQERFNDLTEEDGSGDNGEINFELPPIDKKMIEESKKKQKSFTDDEREKRRRKSFREMIKMPMNILAKPIIKKKPIYQPKETFQLEFVETVSSEMIEGEARYIIKFVNKADNNQSVNPRIVEINKKERAVYKLNHEIVDDWKAEAEEIAKTKKGTNWRDQIDRNPKPMLDKDWRDEIDGIANKVRDLVRDELLTAKNTGHLMSFEFAATKGLKCDIAPLFAIASGICAGVHNDFELKDKYNLMRRFVICMNEERSELEMFDEQMEKIFSKNPQYGTYNQRIAIALKNQEKWRKTFLEIAQNSEHHSRNRLIRKEQNQEVPVEERDRYDSSQTSSDASTCSIKDLPQPTNALMPWNAPVQKNLQSLKMLEWPPRSEEVYLGPEYQYSLVQLIDEDEGDKEEENENIMQNHVFSCIGNSEDQHPMPHNFHPERDLTFTQADFISRNDNPLDDPEFWNEIQDDFGSNAPNRLVWSDRLQEREVDESGEIEQESGIDADNQTEMSENMDLFAANLEEEITQAGRKHVSRRECLNYVLQVRPENYRHNFHPIFSFHKLGQLFQIDQFMKLETAVCDAVRKHKKVKLYSDKETLTQYARKIRDAGRRMKVNIGVMVGMPNTMVGFPGWYKKQYEEAIAIMNREGPPDLFITFTCNPEWPEIKDNLIGSQKWEDNPTVVNKAFRNRAEVFIDALLGRTRGDRRCTMDGIFGKVKALVCSVEFQARGLPHLHCLLTLADDNKLDTAQKIHNVIKGEIPEYLDLHAGAIKMAIQRLEGIIRKQNMHTFCRKNQPRGEERAKTAQCRIGLDPKCKLCARYFPKDLNTEATLKNDGYADPRRKARATDDDNAWVVAYNPALSSLFNCHINVEHVGTINSIKYIYKYIFKGVDKILMEIVQNRGDGSNTKLDLYKHTLIHPELAKRVQDGLLDQWDKEAIKTLEDAGCPLEDDAGRPMAVYDEAMMYRELRSVTACEANYRIQEFPLQYKSHTVVIQSVHLPNKEPIIYDEAMSAEEVLRQAEDSRSRLLAYFKTMEKARQMGYRDGMKKCTFMAMPEYYTYNPKLPIDQRWKIRTKDRRTIGTLRPVWPARKELFALRELAKVIEGATCFEDYLTDQDGFIHPTFAEAAEKRGLLDGEHEWICAMEQAAKEIINPREIVALFAQILIHGNPKNPRELFDRYLPSMVDRKCPGIPRNIRDSFLKARVLKNIQFYIRKYGFQLADYNLEAIDENALRFFEENGIPVLYDEGVQIDVHDAERIADQLWDEMNAEQKKAANLALDKIFHPELHEDMPSMFLQGSGGCGKTHVFKFLHYKLSSMGKRIESMAHTGCAATHLINGMTVHRGFQLPVPANENSQSSINLKDQNPRVIELRRLSCLIWDEATMSDASMYKMVDTILRKIRKNNKPFGGVVVLAGGDWKQILPIPNRDYSVTSPEEITLKSSPLWPKFQKFTLRKNMRAKASPDYAQFLEETGNGLCWLSSESENQIALPEEWVYKNEEDLINFAFPPELLNPKMPAPARRAILTVRNDDADRINKKILARLYGESKIFKSIDKPVQERALMAHPPETFNLLSEGSLPPHQLEIKAGCMVMLLRNLDVSRGLCNGTKLRVDKIFENLLVCYTIPADGKNAQRVPIFKIQMNSKITKNHPQYSRVQFPVKVCYAQTINKAQGATLDKAGIFLVNPVFSHGHLYVALSRVHTEKDIKVCLDSSKESKMIDGKKYYYVPNAVNTEFLKM